MTHPISAMNRAIIDYYRCPENLADFQPAGSVLQDPGYFCFGPETICYGRLSSGSPTQQVIGPLHEVSADVTAGGGIVRLPLDPDQIIHKLRHHDPRCRDTGRPEFLLATDGSGRLGGDQVLFPDRTGGPVSSPGRVSRADSTSRIRNQHSRLEPRRPPLL